MRSSWRAGVRFLFPFGGRETRGWNAFSTILFLSLGLYIFLAPMRLLVMTIVFDDAFYYFKIAENIALGHGSTFDGITITNGYHPLWIWILTAIAYLVPAGEMYTRVAVCTSAALGVLAFRSFIALVHEEYGRTNPFSDLVVIGFLILFVFIVYGLETWLMMYLFIQVLRLLRRNEETRYAYAADVAAAGLCMALLILARLEMAIFCVTLVVTAAPALRRLMRRGRWGAAWSSAAFLLAPPLVMAGGYVLYQQLALGDWRSVSSAAKMMFEVPYAQHSSYGFLAHLRDVVENPVLGTMSALPFVALIIVAWTRRSAHAACAAALVAGCLIHLSAIFVIMKWGEQIWYFFPYAAVFLFLVPRMEQPLPRVASILRRYRKPVMSGVAIVVILCFASKARFDVHDRGNSFMYDLAYLLPAITPDTAIVGAPYCGIIGYLGVRHVLNLDGLVADHAYLDAVRSGHIADYLRRHGVTYFLLPLPRVVAQKDSIHIDFLDDRVVLRREVLYDSTPFGEYPFVWTLFRHPRE